MDINISQDPDVDRFNVATGLTAFGINQEGLATPKKRIAIEKIQGAVYRGDIVAKVTGAVHIQSSKDFIRSIASDRKKIYELATNGGLGTMELYQAIEDPEIPDAVKPNILSALIVAGLKVAVGTAGLSDLYSKKYKAELAELDGQLLTGIRKLVQDIRKAKKEVKKG